MFTHWKTSGGISYPVFAAPHYEEYIQAALEKVPWCSAPARVCEVVVSHSRDACDVEGEDGRKRKA
jgi:hypothetical protein